MKLTMDNILFVKRYEHKGTTYHWFVAMKSRKVSDSRSYVNEENGKSVIKAYPKDCLPKTVQKFLDQNTETQIVEGEEFNIYMTAVK